MNDTIDGLLDYYKAINHYDSKKRNYYILYELFNTKDILQILGDIYKNKLHLRYNDILDNICKASHLDIKCINKLKIIGGKDNFNLFIDSLMLNEHVINNEEILLHLVSLDEDNLIGIKIIDNKKVDIKIKQKIVNNKIKETIFK